MAGNEPRYVEIQIHAIGIADCRRPTVTVAANVHQIAQPPKIPPPPPSRKPGVGFSGRQVVHDHRAKRDLML